MWRDRARLLWKAASNHVGKIMAAIGGTVIGLDLTGSADQLKSYARDFLGPQGGHWMGIILFALMFIRFVYAGWISHQKQQEIDDLKEQLRQKDEPPP